MFRIGALPIITLLPLAFLKMPESVSWLVARGQVDKARAISERTGVPLPEAPTAAAKGRQDQRRSALPDCSAVVTGSRTVAAGFHELNRPHARLLPQHLAAGADGGAGFNAKGSLSFLLVLNGGAILGALAGSRFADRLGPKPVVASCFLIGAGSIALLTLSLPLALLLIFVAVVGLGTSGTQTLIYGFVANYYPTRMRGAGVAWCAGFGRLGGVAGPLLGGFLLPPVWPSTRSFTSWPGSPWSVSF